MNWIHKPHSRFGQPIKGYGDDGGTALYFPVKRKEIGGVKAQRAVYTLSQIVYAILVM